MEKFEGEVQVLMLQISDEYKSERRRAIGSDRDDTTDDEGADDEDEMPLDEDKEFDREYAKYMKQMNQAAA